MGVFRKMKFSFEAPIKYLEELDEDQDYLFIIAHHLNNKKYFEYCKNNDKIKILDNSAYELGESISPEKLKKYAELLKVDIVVLPDKLYDKKRSKELEDEFISLFGSRERKDFEFMKVVCGNNLSEYLESLKENLNDKNVDILGISKSRTSIAPNLSFIMNKYFEYVSETNKEKPIHLLGLSHPFEIKEAALYPCIKSIDTGLPINFAFVDKSFPIVKRNDGFTRISGEDLDSNKPLNVALAKDNVKILKSYYETFN